MNQNLIIWEILSLPKLQRMLKFRDSLWRKLTLEKQCGQPLPEVVRCVMHRSNQPSQQKQLDMDYPRQIYKEPSCVITWIPVTHRRHSRSLWMLYQQKHCWFGLKGTKTGRNNRRLSDFQNSIGKKWTDRNNWLQTYTTFQEKGGMTLGTEVKSCGTVDLEGREAN